VDYIKMNFNKIGWERVDWIDGAGGRDTWQAVVEAVLNFRFPQKRGELLDWVTKVDATFN
jgi:hypothetical protein